MKKAALIMLCVLILAIPVSAAEIAAPQVPLAARERMPESTESFQTGLIQILDKALKELYPDFAQAVRTCVYVVFTMIVVSAFEAFSGLHRKIFDLTGTAAIGALLLNSADAMICLGTETINEISSYGKLLLPVMASAMAAQGKLTSSSALYAGTAIFDSVLTSSISEVLVPGIHIYLALSLANSATGEEMLKKMADFLKSMISWILKTLLIIFTGYISITGVVSGTTDAAALKTAKVTISSLVPVVGGILSDASEAVLVSAGLIKNGAGIYGILAILAIFLEPFLRIGGQYVILKLTAGITTVFGSKRMSDLIGNFSAAMGLLLAMTGASCILCLISTFCFMKGAVS